MAEPSGAIRTVGELLDFYEQNHVVFLKNWKGTSRRLRQYVGQFAALPLADLKKHMVVRWMHEIGRTNGPNAANLALQQLHAMYAKAIDWELYDGRNPADRVKKFPKRSRSRFVQQTEMAWLLHALSEELPRNQTFFLCSLLTAARRGEVRSMRWRDLDLERALWHKPTTKTGVPHTIPLPRALVERIEQLPRISEWVFPSGPCPKNKFTPGLLSLVAIEKAWRRIRKRAGLLDVRIHDLRRTMASWMAIDGENLSVIQQVLNHSSLAVTQVYARLTVQPVREALEKQAERMLRPLQSAPVPPPGSASQERDTPEWPG